MLDYVKTDMNWFKKIANSHKKLIIMRGVSGSGKSSLARDIAEKGGGNIYGSDDFFDHDGRYEFDVNLLHRAHEWNQERVKKALRRGESLIIVDNTNTRAWEMAPYVKMGKDFGYDIEIREPDWSPELKNEEGKWNFDALSGKNTHGVSDDILQKMIDRYEYDLDVEDIIKT